MRRMLGDGARRAAQPFPRHIGATKPQTFDLAQAYDPSKGFEPVKLPGRHLSKDPRRNEAGSEVKFESDWKHAGCPGQAAACSNPHARARDRQQIVMLTIFCTTQILYPPANVQPQFPAADTAGQPVWFADLKHGSLIRRTTGEGTSWRNAGKTAPIASNFCVARRSTAFGLGVAPPS